MGAENLSKELTVGQRVLIRGTLGPLVANVPGTVTKVHEEHMTYRYTVQVFYNNQRAEDIAYQAGYPKGSGEFLFKEEELVPIPEGATEEQVQALINICSK